MRAGDLLLWLSERRRGSWLQFRAAVEELRANDETETGSGELGETSSFPLHQKLRLDLERLGHVEFFTRGCEEGWRVTPPVLAASGVNGSWMGVLCGARSDDLLNRIAQSGAENLQVVQLPAIPDVLRFYVSQKQELLQIADSVGIRLQTEAPLAILSHLPTTAPPTRQKSQVEYPYGADWKIQEFQVDQMGWRTVQRVDIKGSKTRLLRFMIYFQQPRYFLFWEGCSYEVHRAVGIFNMLRRRRKQVLFYNRSNNELVLPAVCRPMRLVERGLVLCSGFPPSFNPNGGLLTYSQVPEDIASLAAQLIGQDLA